MSRLRVHCFTTSLDGYGAGPGQDLQNPLGIGGLELHGWFRPTRVFQKMIGKDGGTTGVDNDFAERGLNGLGAWILGRNMFTPSRGPWPDDGWQGWWGDTPPYGTQVFILTHHAREPIVMNGGTVFNFVTGGIGEALSLARAAANGLDVRLGGGVATVREYLQAGLVDEMHVAVSPVLLGRGENLLQGIDLPKLGYRVAEHVATPAASHVVYTRGD